jgi:hypothetical protein
MWFPLVPLSPPSNLQFSEITYNSARINWEPPQGVKGYRISWVKADGLVEEEVCVIPNVCNGVCVCVCVNVRGMNSVVFNSVMFMKRQSHKSLIRLSERW